MDIHKKASFTNFYMKSLIISVKGMQFSYSVSPKTQSYGIVMEKIKQTSSVNIKEVVW